MPVLTEKELQFGVRYRVRNKAALRVGASMDSARACAPSSLEPGDWYTVDQIERVVGRQGAPVTRLRCAAGRGWISLCSGQGAPLLEYCFRQVGPDIQSAQDVAELASSGGGKAAAAAIESAEDANIGAQGGIDVSGDKALPAMQCTVDPNGAAGEAGSNSSSQAASDSSSDEDGEGSTSSGDGQEDKLRDDSCIGTLFCSVALCGLFVCLACTFAPLFVRGARLGLSERWNQPQQCKVPAVSSVMDGLARNALRWM